jgi:hypothetical protein
MMPYILILLSGSNNSDSFVYIPVELGDKSLLPLLDVACSFRHMPKDSQFVVETCCLEVPAFWK